ncbi:hypothetical protein EMPS_00081 [Entomortierella parvispora]|uniref:Uncharacterized protein n=1 Tax=Entomortierella parvispora TaxID=205924 RepID=A0A9P3LRN1_9FUNG|nr:hypothetical protein EMPS_00081 [Entomortierella parvispora]
MFLLQYQPQIHRVIVVFALICVALDIAAMAKRSSLTCYEEFPNGILGGLFTIVLDLFLLGYYFTNKHDFKFPAGGDRTPRDWNKQPTGKLERPYPGRFVAGKALALGFLLFWPLYEIPKTSQITLPLHPTCSTGTGDFEEGFYRISPLISDVVKYLHLGRARNAISLSICVLLLTDIRISFGRWTLGKKTVAK